MKKYNDYTEAVIRYLRRLNELKAYHENLQEEIFTKEELLRTISAPIAHYSMAPIGGGEGASRVENECERRAQIEDELKGLRMNKSTLAMKLSKIDRALARLDAESREIVTQRWMDGRKWEYIAVSLHCSPKSCRAKSSAALERLALMIFGPQALPDQLSFVFFGDCVKTCG